MVAVFLVFFVLRVFYLYYCQLKLAPLLSLICFRLCSVWFLFSQTIFYKIVILKTRFETNFYTSSLYLFLVFHFVYLLMLFFLFLFHLSLFIILLSQYILSLFVFRCYVKFLSLSLFHPVSNSYLVSSLSFSLGASCRSFPSLSISLFLYFFYHPYLSLS